MSIDKEIEMLEDIVREQAKLIVLQRQNIELMNQLNNTLLNLY